MGVLDLAYDTPPSTKGWQQKPSGWKLAAGWEPADAGTVGVGEGSGWGEQPPQDVGVGAPWDEWWQPEDWWNNVQQSGAAQFAGTVGRVGHDIGQALWEGTVGAEPPKYTDQASPAEYNQINQEHGWSSPGDWFGGIVRDASQGQSDIYERPVVGPLARVAGGIGNAAMGIAGAVPDATVTAGGIIGGAGQVLFDPEHAGQNTQYNYGSLGTMGLTDPDAVGPKAPVARDWGDVLDVEHGFAQGRNRGYAAASPVLQALAGFAGGGLGGKALGLAKDAAGASKAATMLGRVAETGEIFRRMDVPVLQGIAEDVGRWSSQDVVRMANAGTALGGFATGFSQGDPNNPDSLEGRIERGAAYAMPGLLAWGFSKAAGPKLRGFADDYRVVHYGEELMAGDRQVIQDLVAKQTSTPLSLAEQAQLDAAKLNEQKYIATMKAHFPDFGLDEANDRRILDNIHTKLDEANLPVQRAMAPPSPYESPYLQSAVRKFAVSFMNRRANAAAWQDNIETALRAGLGPAQLPSIDAALGALAGIPGATSQMVSQLRGLTIRRLGLDGKKAAQDVLNDFDNALLFYDRATFKAQAGASAAAAQVPLAPTAPRDLIQQGMRQEVQDALSGAARAPIFGPPAPGFKASGPNMQSMEDVVGNLWFTAQRVERLYGPGKATKWMDELFSENERRSNALMRLLGDQRSNAMDPATIQKVIDEHGIYGALREVGARADETAAKGWSSNMLMNFDEPIDRAYTNSEMVKATMETLYHHDAAVVATAFQNRAFTTLKNARDQVQGLSGLMVPMLEKDPITGLPVAGKFLTPEAVQNGNLLKPGWSLMTGLNKGATEVYAVPSDLAQAYRSMSPGTADKYIQLMGKWSEPFRLGVTSRSPFFILGNSFRDWQDAFQNSNLPPAVVMRNIITQNLNLVAYGVDEWMQANPNNKLIQALPAKVEASMRNILEQRSAPVREYIAEGGGGQTFTEAMRTREAVSSVMGLKPDWYQTPVLGGLGRLIKTPADLLEAASYTSEMATRMAVYQGVLDRGATIDQAIATGRSVTVDFSKGGEFFKTFGMLMPLVNARIQGQLRSAEAFQDDPNGYLHRLALTSAVPAMALYAYNRLHFGHLYDDVPQDDRDRNFIVGYGSIKDGRDPANKERLLYFKIPKNDAAAVTTAPLEHLMDTMFHVKDGQTDLKDPQRHERSAGRMWLAQFANMLPISMNANDVGFGETLWHSFIGMNPLAGTIDGMAANRDYFRDQPIIGDDQLILPKEFQRGPHDQEAPWLSRALARWSKDLNLPEQLRPAPPHVAFLANHLGGTAATMLLGTTDYAWQKFREAGLGVPDYKPASIEDLHIPEGTDPQAYEAYLAAANQVDFRPWQQQALYRFYGMGGGQQTIAGKTQQMGRTEKETWEQTTGYFAASNELRAEIQVKKDAIYNDPHLSANEILGRIHDLNIELQDRKKQMKDDKYPHALVDPNERQKFIQALPGLPIDPEQFKPQALPEGVNPAQLWADYSSAGGQDLSQMNDLQQYQTRQQWLRKTADGYGVSAAVLREYVAAGMLNGKLPSVPVPDAYLNDLVDTYMDPPNRQDPLNPREKHLAQQVLIKNEAAKWGLPEGDLLDRVQTRLVSLMDNGPRALSRDRALALSATVNDERAFPPFVDNDGKPVGAPGEWPTWQAELKWLQDRYPNKPYMWPAPYDELAEAQSRANVQKLQALYQDPSYYDYAGWFGQGKNMSPAEWDKFTSGEMPRYDDNPGAAESARRDAVIRLYQTLPRRDPERNALRSEARLYRKWLVPGWRSAMELDDVGNRIQGLDELYTQLAA